MKRARILCSLAIAAVATPGTAMPVQVGPRCTSLDELVSPAAFRRYPVNQYRGPLRKPDVRRGRAHLYRTALGSSVRDAPDFAGHYQVVPLGCGAATYCPAFVDRVTGKVSFYPELRAVSVAGTMMEGHIDERYGNRLLYRADSRLLALIGSRNEDERTEGVTLYEWQARGPRLIRFIPTKQICRIPL